MPVRNQPYTSSLSRKDPPLAVGLCKRTSRATTLLHAGIFTPIQQVGSSPHLQRTTREHNNKAKKFDSGAVRATGVDRRHTLDLVFLERIRGVLSFFFR